MHCLFSLSFFSSLMYLWSRRAPSGDVRQRPWRPLSLKVSTLMPNVSPQGYLPFPQSEDGKRLKLIVRLSNSICLDILTISFPAARRQTPSLIPYAISRLSFLLCLTKLHHT